MTSQSEHQACDRCHVIAHYARVSRARRKIERNRIIHVQTWCRVCGLPSLLEVVNDYALAKRNFYALDDQPMAHRHVHADRGGWGLHWRLGEVLAAVFGRQHEDDDFPVPPWYSHHESLEHPVKVLATHDELVAANEMQVDVELRMLRRFVNGNGKRTREELAKLILTEIFDGDQVRERFEVLGFRAPFVVVRDKQTGERGSLLFQDMPRLYFGFDPHRVI